MIFTLVSCSSTTNKKDLVQKYSLDKESAHNWETVMPNVMMAEATNPDWYGEDNPLISLRKQGKMSEREYYFLDYLGKTPANQITDEEFDRFAKILTSFVNRTPRNFILEETNIKDPKGLVDFIVKEANSSQLDNPSKYIKEVVADKEEWAQIVALSQKADLNSKDVRKLRKLLVAFVKRENFFNEQVWLQVEVSDRVLKLAQMARKVPKTKRELNNVNAKALYLAYPQFLSKIDRWSR
ncbi:hypothetical protein CTM86_06165 [Fusobacterium pseudoperiodonticum]|uniref:Uncharacterized protein n=2 Tax=Fusobacterium pseudoperiodonticum TaxID=2663009 RepID=A0A2G9EJR0_9FUSO|nr:hypothetical protein CTM78_02770 [Fusobacterium pseudoperiodonticum]ATV67086.1 hypothetical protein CTM86_06165 [Fusobacterium pseudoperiodonticum]ATV69135.1 hypothetical protein CTM92_02675 [Fusobacterium pseudoperiodonticum]ATV73512.1 hypothetical protein CTN00_03020 [Fusobacterium pseudoperiodonticum]PIM81133.1 hypothetical protein CTM71_11710 [Fusobacterium pseudoperiodonticum]